LRFFVFLSSYFFFSEFHFALCVVNALIKGEIEDQERPVRTRSVPVVGG
jgi:hypothetical protein